MASRDLGELGPTEGEPTVREWSVLYNLSVLLPWVVLLLLLLLRPRNRSLAAWAVLMPVAIFSAPMFAAHVLSAVLGAGFPLFVPELIAVFSVSLAALWLVADRLAKDNRVLAGATALGIVFFMGLLGALSISGFGFDASVAGLFFVNGAAGVILILAMALAGWCCRKHYSTVAFTLWLFLWSVGATLVLPVCIGIVSSIPMFAMMDDIAFAFMMLFGVVVMGIGCAVAFIVILIPYLLLLFGNSVYRARFEAVCRLGTREPAAGEAHEPGPE